MTTTKKAEFKIVYADSMVEPYFVKRYKSRKCAQNAADKLNLRYKKQGYEDNRFLVYSFDDYATAVKGKGEWRVSARDGKTPVWVALGTPLCCDPSSETYWSM
jgi:hypothetical protein